MRSSIGWGLCIAGGWLLLGCGREFSSPPLPPEPGVVQGDLDLDGQPGADLSGARVRLLECGLSAVADAEGLFRFPAVPSGDYSLLADADLVVLGVPMSYSLHRALDVVVRGPAPADLGALVFGQSGAAPGTLSQSDGESPLGAVVFAVDGVRVTAVGYNGAFVLEHLPAGTWRLSAARPGYQVRESVEVDVPAGGAAPAVSLILDPAPEGTGTVQGRVLLGNPGPEPGVRVDLKDRMRLTSYGALTDEDGNFSRAGLPPGLYQLVASHPGYRSAGLPILEVRAGETLDVASTLILPPDDGVNPWFPWDGDPTGELDDDGDGIPDTVDNCPLLPNPDQLDQNGNGLGDACEGFLGLDPDGDGIPSEQDNCPWVANPDQANHDSDPLGDACDLDDDDDGRLDTAEVCDFIPNPEGNDLVCNWPGWVIYSAQDARGFIQLRRVQMRGEVIVDEALTALDGDSWGAEPDGAGAGVYFHHRGLGEDDFRLAWIPVPNPAPESIQRLDLGPGSVMNPAVCGEQLLFDRFMGDHWEIHARPLALPELGPDADPGLRAALEEIGAWPPRAVSLRRPTCAPGRQGITLVFSADFVALLPPDTPYAFPELRWSMFEGSFSPLGNEFSLGPALMPPAVSCDLLNAAVVSEGVVLDCHTEGSSTLMTRGTEPWGHDLTPGAGRAEEPAAYWNTELGVGLMAYSRLRDGSMDLVVAGVVAPAGGAPSLARPTWITAEPGWEGSPVWLPDPP